MLMLTTHRNWRIFPSLGLFLLFLFCVTASAAPIIITAPGDPIQIVNGLNDGDANSGNSPSNEGADKVIDGSTRKYLNFQDLGSGFMVTPSMGASIVTRIRFYTANDNPARDPASYLLEGSNAGFAGAFTSISSGALTLPTARNTITPPGTVQSGNQSITTGFNYFEVLFSNVISYTTYRITFPTLRDAALANSMQIAEVQLMMEEPVAIPEPSTVALLGLPLLGLLYKKIRSR